MIAASSVARRRREVAMVLAVSGLFAAVAPATAAPVPGSAGTDTALPATESQVTMSGRGRFASLKVTVNQTKKLVNQAVSVTWKGGTATENRIQFQGHYLQIMQCWGDDDGTVPGNPGPPPEQCVQGATDGVPGGRNGDRFPAGGFTLQRIVSQKGLWPGFDAETGYLEDKTGYLWKPFRAVNGSVVNVQADLNFDPLEGKFWLNPDFDYVTTNEIPGGRTGQNGEGAALFAVNTGQESAGLGCGRPSQSVADGPPRVPKCWLVIVPRGSPEDENAGSPHGPGRGAMTSPLSSRSWRNRIAVPLEFIIDRPCSLADDQRRLVGTDLAAPAVLSWQPKLCSTPGLPPFTYTATSDSVARQQLLRGGAGAPGMVVVSRPLDRSRLDAANPVTYAPISLSALVIGFNIERRPRVNLGPDLTTAIERLRGVPVANVNLTPRLMAKLLTQSYRSQVAIKETLPSDYGWARDNPPHVGRDPDFLQFNPEFELLENGGKNFGGLMTALGTSDAARQVWEWLLSDPEARAWLDGAPDPWGMDVNPAYATSAKANSLGVAFADPVPESLPKADPYCYQAPPLGNGSLVPPALCGNDWLPYARTMADAARLTRAADDGARTTEDLNAQEADKVYKRDGPQVIGSRTILALTDSASAVQYGIQMARLSRAGDNGPGRAFIAPDVAGLTAGVASMAAKDEPAVLEPVPTATAAAAYPLTALTYAAITPLSLDDKARREYAAFVDYAAGPGQVTGLERGQLPRGFVPLPESLRAQATAAAKTIRELQPAPGETDLEPSGPAPVSAAPGPSPFSSGSSGGGGGLSTTPPASRPGVTQTAAAPTTTPPTTTPPTTTPRATTPLARALTPVLAMAHNRFVLPALLGIALLSSLGALEITRRPIPAPGGQAAPGGRVPGDHKVGAALMKRVSRWAVKR